MTTETLARPAPLDERSRDYPRIVAALDYLDAHWRDQPALDDVADAAGLSPHHFQRVFTRWTGASPKRMLSALTHAAARRLLADGASVMDAAFETGLSGPSRLHDVFIAEEAVTPGEAKRAGAGLEFAAGYAPTPFGMGVFLVAPKGLSGLAFADAGDEEHALADLAARFPDAVIRRDDAVAADWAARAFDGASGDPIPLALYGTPWRRQVWRALLAIPPGRAVSYRDVAERVCTAKAARAVGAAVGANPVSWLIPCHRVLSSDGRLTGYHWGLPRKRAMLAYEAASD
ncbi:6-O-methylguanine DNA methyltransferase [Marinicauda salina]|uniref:methylated-DNA--[protein]-cysteine S-methyltransferase n=1 Tax=Marinicauda salina TaxID=2135793 RepID=A0A2U2BWM4_9PROT|nr:bifunctional helix-turn-helix domain-containing protein/methylated-DNA--[protein]-cysteine S-methyltransferase [Marinicauda salina]PWE18379.1 6-O-methylguanine DNA methyltransferase [Marinicauda salina]